jgi:hypothetical protein
MLTMDVFACAVIKKYDRSAAIIFKPFDFVYISCVHNIFDKYKSYMLFSIQEERKKKGKLN